MYRELWYADSKEERREERNRNRNRVILRILSLLTLLNGKKWSKSSVLFLVTAAAEKFANGGKDFEAEFN